jgi:hypothetical protein
VTFSSTARASRTGLNRERARMTLCACRDEVRADEWEVDIPELVTEMTDWASDALSELIPGVRVAAKSLHIQALD